MRVLENKIEVELLLRSQTEDSWWSAVESDWAGFLVDHAACERKAAATGIQFVVKYPDRLQLIEPMIRLAREELLHFHQVSRLLVQLGLQQKGDEKDPYVNLLLGQMRNPPEERFLDRLLIFGIIEARGTERFGIVAQKVKDPEMANFYKILSETEARHHQLFTELACEYFSTDLVQSRLHELLDIESNILKKIPVRAAVH